MPIPANPRYSVVQYLLAEKEHIALLNKLLQDSAQSLMQLIIANAAKTGPTAALTSVQMRAQLASILAYQKNLWRDIEELTRKGQSDAAYAASRTVSRYENELLKLVVKSSDLADLTEAEALRASAGVQSALSRILSSEMPLSERVYRAQALSNNQISDVVNQSLALGDNAAQLAAKVRDLILPSVPGGVSYSARRLARTEINNAYHATTVKRYQDSKIVEEVDWVLSSSHPEGDECDDLVAKSPYPVRSVPRKPHPQCFCGIQPHLPDPDEFLKKLLKGDYGDTPWSGAVDPDKVKTAAANSTTLPTSAKKAAEKLSPHPLVDGLPKLPVLGKSGPILASNSHVTDQQIVNPFRYDTAKKGELVRDSRGRLATDANGLYFKATKNGKNAFDAYSINCTRTSAAIEMRARGYAVTAGPKPKPVHDNYDGNIVSMWKDPNTGLPRAFTRYSGDKTRSAYDAAIADTMKNNPPGSRFFVIGVWKGGHSSHIWNAEIGADGVFRNYEGQTISDPNDYWKGLSPTHDVEILRVDDLEPTDKLVKDNFRYTNTKQVNDGPWLLPAKE